MIRTKHAFLVTIFVVVIVCVCSLTLFFSVGPGTLSLYGTGVKFGADVKPYNANVLENKSQEEARAALIARLSEGGSASSNMDTTNIATDTVESTPGKVLGDGHISTSPKSGYIFACEQNFKNDVSSRNGSWIEDSSWFPDKKVSVDGGVSWPGTISISLIEGARIISTNALPPHTTGVFPISPSDDAYVYDKNPNHITSQSIYTELLQTPYVSPAPHCVPMGIIGIALNGVPIFNGLDSKGKDALAHELQDSCGGHPDQVGTYHYHNESPCMDAAGITSGGSTLVGYALDGFGIFGSTENNAEITNSDLDACHGHSHMISWDGEMKEIYHYHMTDEYPYSVGCFMGTPSKITTSSPLESGNSVVPLGVPTESTPVNLGENPPY